MKDSIDSNRWFLRLLIACSIAIWGTVGFRFWNGNLDERSPSGTRRGSQRTTFNERLPPIDDAFLALPGSCPNPFVAPHQRRHGGQSKPPPVSAVVPVPEPPDVTVTAFFVDRSGRLAVIENSSGETALAAVGDSLFGIRIISIGDDIIKFRYQQADFELRFGENEAGRQR